MSIIRCFLFLLLGAVACSQGKDNINVEFKECNDIKISVTDTINFPLDSMTAGFTTMSQGFGKYYTFLSYGKPKRILFYDIESEKLQYSLFVEELVSYNVSGYLVQNLDSIFLFSYGSSQITLVNIEKQILNQWKLPPFRRGYRMSPRVITGRPLLIKNGTAYCGGLGTGEPSKGQNIITEISLQSKSVKTSLEYPDFYAQSNWGGLYYRYLYFTKSLENNFVLSFPASHFVYETSDFEKLRSHYGGSCKIKSISPLRGISTKVKKVKHFQTNYSYKTIIADPFREVYYRVYEKPIEFKERNPWSKPCGLIVLNKDFNYIGEFELNIENISPMWHYTAFVSPKGLCVQMKPDSKEEYLSFATLTFEKKPIQ